MKSDPKIILENVPIAHKENVPIAREYIRSNEIHELAVQKYRHNGKGITFNDLISRGITKTKAQAQRKLKYCLKNRVLFIIYDHKPQQYYPACIKSHILEKKNAPIDPTVVHQYCYHHYNNSTSSSLIANILPLLPTAPSYIHNMHFKLKLSPQCYLQLNLPQYNSNNKGKHQYENIASTHIDYTFYPKGTVDVTVKC